MDRSAIYKDTADHFLDICAHISHVMRCRQVFAIRPVSFVADVKRVPQDTLMVWSAAPTMKL